PLFSGTIRQTELELTDSKIYGSGVVLLQYRVKR
ncbi:MAG: dihydrofolate reductase, partial [Acidobacteriota bacterium]|nr:dihydrofolate reductase [Acidobacteriota bacterium]